VKPNSATRSVGSGERTGPTSDASVVSAFRGADSAAGRGPLRASPRAGSGRLRGRGRGRHPTARRRHTTARGRRRGAHAPTSPKVAGPYGARLRASRRRGAVRAGKWRWVGGCVYTGARSALLSSDRWSAGGPSQPRPARRGTGDEEVMVDDVDRVSDCSLGPWLRPPRTYARAQGVSPEAGGPAPRAWPPRALRRRRPPRGRARPPPRVASPRRRFRPRANAAIVVPAPHTGGSLGWRREEAADEHKRRRDEILDRGAVLPRRPYPWAKFRTILQPVGPPLGENATASSHARRFSQVVRRHLFKHCVTGEIGRPDTGALHPNLTPKTRETTAPSTRPSSAEFRSFPHTCIV
jgi:hypothetical protein